MPHARAVLDTVWGAAMSDSYTETTTKSWMSRITESIKGVLFGIVLVIGSCIFLFWNEGRAVQTARSLTEGAGVVVTVDPAKVDPANEGKLVHVNGDLNATTPLADPDFGVSAQGLRLLRDVEMYQWKEESKSETRKTLGGGEETVTTYTYVRTWSDSRIDSSRFKEPSGHTNPEMRYQGTSVVARDATLGAFRPGENVVRLLPASQSVTLDPALATQLRERLKSPLHVANNRIYLGVNPAEPRIGDLRIGYRLAPNGPVSIIGRQAGNGFADYQTQAGDRLLMVQPGTYSAADMFKQAERENTIMTWLFRLVGMIAMAIGFYMIMAPLVVVADVVPLIGNILSAGAGIVALLLTAILAPLVIAIAWFWYRPLVSAIVLALGLAAAFGFKVLAARRAAARTSQPAAA
jgi:hypothetical protein